MATMWATMMLTMLLMVYSYSVARVFPFASTHSVSHTGVAHNPCHSPAHLFDQPPAHCLSHNQVCAIVTQPGTRPRPRPRPRERPRVCNDWTRLRPRDCNLIDKGVAQVMARGVAQGWAGKRRKAAGLGRKADIAEQGWRVNGFSELFVTIR